MIKVFVWPDGEWVLEDDYNELDYNHKSDDYFVLRVKEEKDIEQAVQILLTI